MAFRLQRHVAVLIMSVGIMGCVGSNSGSKPSLQADPQKVVADLALGRWDALIKRDFAKAYTYLSPGTREIMSLDLYKARISGGKWKKATVDSVSCEQEQCKVLMAVEYSYREVKSVDARLNENWLRQDGKWWHVPLK